MSTNTNNLDLLTSIRRTVVPFIMGWIVTLPVAQFIDTAEVERALVVLIGSAYYAALRWLESRNFPAASWWIAFGPTPAPRYEQDGE